MRPLDVGTALQWLVLLAFGGLALACLYALARKPSLVGVAVALLSLALNYAAYYIVFLVFPDRLDAFATMMWSIVTKLHTAGTGGVILRAAWKESNDRR